MIDLLNNSDFTYLLPFILTVNLKQERKHIFSNYSWLWLKQFGKTSVDKGKLYKVARAIIKAGAPGTACLAMILKTSMKAFDVRGLEEFGGYTLEEDMPARVAAVKALIAGQIAFSFFENKHASCICILTLTFGKLGVTVILMSILPSSLFHLLGAILPQDTRSKALSTLSYSTCTYPRVHDRLSSKRNEEDHGGPSCHAWIQDLLYLT